jgi:protein-S-isoprenylcysteine O-methyltransferase Ste14
MRSGAPASSRVVVAVKLLSIAGYLMMLGGILALIVTRTIVSASVPAIIAQVAALVLMLWARRTFGRRSFHLGADPTDGGLVTAGPFRFVRHPIYTAVSLFVWAAALGSPSVRTLAFAVLVTIGAIMRIFCEERLLVRRYPEYVVYSRTTKRMIPFVF